MEYSRQESDEILTRAHRFPPGPYYRPSRDHDTDASWKAWLERDSKFISGQVNRYKQLALDARFGVDQLMGARETGKATLTALLGMLSTLEQIEHDSKAGVGSEETAHRLDGRLKQASELLNAGQSKLAAVEQGSRKGAIRGASHIIEHVDDISSRRVGIEPTQAVSGFDTMRDRIKSIGEAIVTADAETEELLPLALSVEADALDKLRDAMNEW